MWQRVAGSFADAAALRGSGITVNDLLSGERVAQADYQKKAEENMMELIRENAENKKRLALSLICAAITGIAVCALIGPGRVSTLPAAARLH